MIQAPTNNVIVGVKTKWIGNWTKIMRIAAIQNNTSVEPANLVNIIGEVVSIPRTITTYKIDYAGYSTRDIRAGDTVIFSYLVIFNFIDTHLNEEPVYKNLMWWRGQEYFMCDIQNLFAVIRNDQIRMQNGYVMVEQMEAPPKIYLHQNVKKKIRAASAIVSKIGHPLTTEKAVEVQPGDTVYFNPNVIQLYQIKEKPFGIIKQSHILGRKIPDYGELAPIIQM